MKFNQIKNIITFNVLMFLILPTIIFSFNVPSKPVSFVSDYASILKEDERQSIENKLVKFEQDTSNEIAVVTIKSLGGEDIADVAQQFFTQWSIGKKDKNNGALLLVSLDDRKTRIHTGYGLEGSLTDLGTSYIQNDVLVPWFRKGEYGTGINLATDEIIKSIQGENIVPDNYESSKENNNSLLSKILNNFEFFGFLFFILVQVLFSLLGRSKSWWAGGVLGGVVGLLFFIFASMTAFLIIPMVLFGLLLDYLVSKHYSSINKFGGPHFWGGGFGGRGGGGGGGFGGFGGGSSGGGGSSSSW